MECKECFSQPGDLKRHKCVSETSAKKARCPPVCDVYEVVQKCWWAKCARYMAATAEIRFFQKWKTHDPMGSETTGLDRSVCACAGVCTCVGMAGWAPSTV